MKEITNNKKYLCLLNTSRELFWKYGFRRVTIDEICREAKVSKMTFYSYFSNKLDLARVVLDRVFEESMFSFRQILKENASPSEKMKKILQLKLDGSKDISNDFLSDFYNNPELGLTEYIEAKTKEVLEDTIEAFRDGQKEGWLRKDMNVDFIFYVMMKSTPLVSDPELLKMFNSPQELIMELSNFFIYGMSPVNQK